MSRMITLVALALVAIGAIMAVLIATPFSTTPPEAFSESEWDGGNVAPGREPPLESAESAMPAPVIVAEEEFAAAPEEAFIAMDDDGVAFDEPIMEAPVVETIDETTDDDGYSHVTLFFATNRKLAEVSDPTVPTSQFENVNATDVTWGLAEVSIPDTHLPGQLETQNRFVAWILPPNPTKHVILNEITPMDSEDVLQTLSDTLAVDNAVLMYIHGFNTPMELAARRSGQLTFDVGWNGPSMFFSWPSQGNPLSYTVDANMAIRSERALMEVLQEVAATSAERIVIIAHSMGTQLLTQSLLRLDEDTRGRITTIVLAAPDIDADVFKEDILPVFDDMKDTTKVTLYASSNDLALQASHKVNGFTRIGDSQNGIEPLDPVDVIDASEAESDFFEHTYFGSNATILDDIKEIVRNSAPPQERSFLVGVPDVRNGPTWQVVLPE